MLFVTGIQFTYTFALLQCGACIMYVILSDFALPVTHR